MVSQPAMVSHKYTQPYQTQTFNRPFHTWATVYAIRMDAVDAASRYENQIFVLKSWMYVHICIVVSNSNTIKRRELEDWCY